MNPKLTIAILAALTGAVTYMASYGGLEVPLAWVAGIVAGTLLRNLRSLCP